MSGARSLRVLDAGVAGADPEVQLQLEVGRLRLGPDQERVGRQRLGRGRLADEQAALDLPELLVTLPAGQRRAIEHRLEAGPILERQRLDVPRALRHQGAAGEGAGAQHHDGNDGGSHHQSSTNNGPRAYCGGGLNRNASRSASWRLAQVVDQAFGHQRHGRRLARGDLRLGDLDRPLGRRHLQGDLLGVLARDQAEQRLLVGGRDLDALVLVRHRPRRPQDGLDDVALLEPRRQRRQIGAEVGADRAEAMALGARLLEVRPAAGRLRPASGAA